ncbi:MAG: hypothetical protein JO223_07535 [Hyphomicrobiales bacterium]|nr:hypothetical protein [Hyphomicrobiales bacterium]
MKHHKARRMALLALAMAFLALATIWDGLIAIERLIVPLIPWTRVKYAFAVVVDFLPAPAVLLIFLVPLLIIEPLLTVCVVAIAMGYVVTGVIAWVLLKLLAIALIPAIFDLTQYKLMTMPWFVWAYDKVIAWHHYADRIVAPYKHAAAALLRQWRRRAAAMATRTPGVAQLAARFAARKRAANGRPPVPTNG